MHNYRIDLEYDGAPFHGWQVQPKLRTVQGDLIQAVERIVRHPIQLTGAGRTDAGVHALGQVANFKSKVEIPPEVLMRRLNRSLPDAIRVNQVRQVSEEFSARHSAVTRYYRYGFLLQPSAIWRSHFHVVTHSIDTDAMVRAAELFLGEQDFSAFAVAGSAEHYRCMVNRSSFKVRDHEAVFEISANRFLHNMVRRLAGALLEVGKHRLSPRDLKEILTSGNRKRGGPCLPPQGLYLVAVRYPGEVPRTLNPSLHGQPYPPERAGLW